MCGLVATAPTSAMQQMTRQEAELLQTEQFFEEQIERSQEKFWERIRNVFMLWCGMATFDRVFTETTPEVSKAFFWKGHPKSSYVLGSLGALITLREFFSMIGDVRKIAECTRLIMLVRQQLADLEDKRRLRRPAPKPEEAPADNQSQN